MNQKRNLWEKLTGWLVGGSNAGLSQPELGLWRTLSDKLDDLSVRLDGQTAELAPGTGLDELQEQVQKLAKTQFKANSLQETQQAHWQATLEGLQKALALQDQALAELAKQREQTAEAARLEALKRILPALDSLDAAFNNGRRQVLQLPMSQETRQAVIAWLDGLRLARLRLLDALASGNIRPIPTIGQPFDPHYHVAVATDASGRAPDGIIVSEDRPGFASPTKVLREAEVVVARKQ